jgi:hypothetical protein
MRGYLIGDELLSVVVKRLEGTFDGIGNNERHYAG